MKKLSIEEAQDLFLKSNYILLDSIFWEDLFLNLKIHNINYITIGLDYFGHKELCPILIDLGGVENRLVLWKEFGEKYYINAISEFDHMSIFQNFIKTDAKIDKIKDYIKRLMVVRSNGRNKIFRFYDSRVIMYLNYFMNSTATEFENCKENILSLKIDNWVINVSGNYYSILDGIENEDKKNDYNIDFFYKLTGKLRENYSVNSSMSLNESIEKEIKVIING